MITRMQRRHFLLLDVLPAVGSLLSVPILIKMGLVWADWVALAIMWLLTVTGIEVGYHRYFSHHAFEAKPWVKGALVILASMAGQGSVISWASNHRHHHQFSDRPGDTHSPYFVGGATSRGLRGFLHAQVGWKWTYPYPNPAHYTPGLLADPMVQRLSRRYRWWVLLGVVAPGVIVGAITWSAQGVLTGTLFAGVVRLFLSQQGTFSVNSLGHMVGTRYFDTPDKSRNGLIMVIPTLGGSLHNNHHAFPTAASNKHRWWHLDPSWWTIRGLERAGLAWDVRRVDDEARAKRLAGAAD